MIIFSNNGSVKNYLPIKFAQENKSLSKFARNFLRGAWIYITSECI